MIDVDWMNLHHSSDFVRIHDYFVNLENRRRAEERARYDQALREQREKYHKKYAEILKKNKEKYNFENEEYLIRCPEDPEKELPTEGQMLNHCVGGYIDRQLQGSTNILFLRQKCNPNNPFMTIEVNDERVVQIHGRYNAWLGSNPEYIKAIPFVMKWLYKTNTRCPKNILTNRALGYCERKELGYVELPKIDLDMSKLIY